MKICRYLILLLIVAVQLPAFAQSNVDREALRSFLEQVVQNTSKSKVLKRLAEAEVKPATSEYLQSVNALVIKASGENKFLVPVNVMPDVAIISDTKSKGVLRVIFTTSAKVVVNEVEYNANMVWVASEIEVKGKKNFNGGVYSIESISVPFAEYLATADAAFANENNWGQARVVYQKARASVSSYSFDACKRLDENHSTIMNKFNSYLAEADNAYDAHHFAQAQTSYLKAQRIDDNTYIQRRISYIRVLLNAQQLVAKSQREVARIHRNPAASQLFNTLHQTDRLCNEINAAIDALSDANVIVVQQKYFQLQECYTRLVAIPDVTENSTNKTPAPVEQ